MKGKSQTRGSIVPQLRQSLVPCGWCSDVYTVDEVMKRALSVDVLKEHKILFVVWKCKRGHENYSAVPIDRS